MIHAKTIFITVIALAAQSVRAVPVSAAFPWAVGTVQIETGMTFEAFREVNTTAAELYPSAQTGQPKQGGFADLNADGSTLVYNFVRGKLGSVWWNFEQKPSLEKVQTMRAELIARFGNPKPLESAALDNQQRAVKLLLEEYNMGSSATIRFTATNKRIQVFLNDEKVLLEAGETPKILTFEAALASSKKVAPNAPQNGKSDVIDFVSLIRASNAQQNETKNPIQAESSKDLPSGAAQAETPHGDGLTEGTGFILYVAVGGFAVVLLLILLRSFMKDGKQQRP